jgi:hypothetical protein
MELSILQDEAAFIPGIVKVAAGNVAIIVNAAGCGRARFRVVNLSEDAVAQQETVFVATRA